MRRSAQGSLEYLLLLGVSIVIIMIVVGYVAKFSHSEAEMITEMNNKNVNSVMNAISNISSGEINS
ncbi:hypothetical protein PAP_03675 [Palaeococcus pacificus DY20341]|uniref:Class III signal peptide-containing protein n=1 Tax=Palaeococcus pacificus DY20341 TaxID=1343739 RepID=A0A075LR13_9EURY|nr:class III signal peptide-containing protein [Palaeococcus pacificus]AIF69155.1 hypothetical protein PAP_03675 [Palaeococcus pacificus DY20341]